MNPLFNQFGQQNIVQQFMNFKNSFRGDPRQQIQQMLNSGRISQQQYNDAVQKAQALQRMLNMK